MTNGLGLFLAFYILVGQPAILGWMLDNYSLYQLAGLNAGIFFIAWIISAMSKPAKKKTKSESITSQLLGENVENNPSSGVSVVKVQETTTVKEIEVAKVDVKEELPEPEENISEKLEEENKEEVKEEIEKKSEDKTPEKPMRESVSIPKIVQPLSGRQAPKKRKKEVKWGQRLILLLTLGVAGLLAWTLWEFLGNRGIAIALFLGWILYLVIGKLFDVNGFYDAKKLFTNWLYIVLILAGIGYGVYAMQSQDKSLLPSDFTEKVSSYFKGLFEKDGDETPEVNTGDIIYVFEGTGEVITDVEDNTEILDETGVVEIIPNTETDTGIIENVEPEIVQPEPIADTPSLSEEEAKKQVTMGDAIKSLLAGATLSTKTNVSFKYVSKSNELYPYFKTAQERWMIGTDTNPSKIVSCDTYITMKGIWEGRDVGSYTKSNVKAVYWAKAEQLGKLNGCQKGKYLTKGNL